jgi:hypothetical protein
MKRRRNPDDWFKMTPKSRALVRAGIFRPDDGPLERLMLAVGSMLEEGRSMHADNLSDVCNEVYEYHDENFEAATAAILAGQHPLLELAPNDYAVGGIDNGKWKTEEFARVVRQLLDDGRVCFEDGYYSVVPPKLRPVVAAIRAMHPRDAPSIMNMRELAGEMLKRYGKDAAAAVLEGRATWGST